MAMWSGWNSYNNFLWTSSTNTTSTTWPVTVAISSQSKPAPTKKRSLLDWLADEVDAVCALTREAA